MVKPSDTCQMKGAIWRGKYSRNNLLVKHFKKVNQQMVLSAYSKVLNLMPSQLVTNYKEMAEWGAIIAWILLLNV